MSAVFVNLPVRDLGAAVAFFGALGLTAEQVPPNATSTQLTLPDTLHVILHTEPAFAAFAQARVCDTGTAREVIVGVAVDSRDRVDALVERAVAAGGGDLGPGQDLGYLYMRGFRDLDGHQWSFLHLTG